MCVYLRNPGNLEMNVNNECVKKDIIEIIKIIYNFINKIINNKINNFVENVVEKTPILLNIPFRFIIKGIKHQYI